MATLDIGYTLQRPEHHIYLSFDDADITAGLNIPVNVFFPVKEIRINFAYNIVVDTDPVLITAEMDSLIDDGIVGVLSNMKGIAIEQTTLSGAVTTTNITLLYYNDSLSTSGILTYLNKQPRSYGGSYPLKFTKIGNQTLLSAAGIIHIHLLG